jgi:hypothetical protein
LESADKGLASQAPSVRKDTLDKRVRALGELAAALGLSAQCTRRSVTLVRHVKARPGLWPLRSLRPLLRAMPSGAAALPEVQALRAAVVEALREALSLPEPAAHDHSLLDVEWTCRPVIDWAASSSPRPLTLPMAEARRDHVQTQLKAAAAPVCAETIKQGSPYKLLLSKPIDLSARRRALRQAWADDLATLEPWSRRATGRARARRALGVPANGQSC